MKSMGDNGSQGTAVSDLIRGLVYTHNRANANTAELHQASATVRALVELLIEGGVLDRDALDARRQHTAEQLRGQYFEQGMGVVMQEFEGSKYAFQGGVTIDCENRIPLCKAACCRLPFALSKEDVREGIVRWDLGRPYMIAQGSDGACVHREAGTCRCAVYAHRPVPCRGYDCRKDKRIWLDFENRVVNPCINDPTWPRSIQAADASVAETD